MIKDIKNNFFMFKYLWRARKSYLFLNIGVSCFNSASEVVRILLYKSFIDLLAGQADFWVTIPILIAYGLLSKVHEVFYEYVYQIEAPKANFAINKSIVSDVMEKALDVDLECFDNSEFYDQYTRALAETSDRSMSILNNISSFIYSVIALIGLISVILVLDPITLILSLLLAVVSPLFLKKIDRYTYERDRALTPLKRFNQYCTGMFFSRNQAKDIRMNPGIADHFKDSYKNSLDKSLELYTKKSKSIFALKSIKSVLAIVFEYLLPLAYLGYLAVNSFITIGDVTALWEAIKGIANTIGGFAYNYEAVKQASLYIENLKYILNYSPKIKTDKSEKTDLPEKIIELEFCHVWFRYTEDSEYVLKDIHIKISQDEKIALVGHNGSGKSTLIKLLLRLYDPTSGCIRINGIDIKQFDVEGYRSLFTSVFQDFSVFATSVSVNVLCRNVLDQEDERLVEEALKSSGLYEKIAESDAGIQRQVTKEFDDNGILLSGGELQKLALSRIFAKSSPILILDEPSSALDPEAEYEFHQAIAKVSSDKIVVLISHRLSTTIHSNKIFMLEKGAVIEEGTHNELMSRNGRYAHIFNLQAEKYRIHQDALMVDF